MEDKDCLIDSLHLHGLKYTIFFQRAWLFSLTGVTQKRNPICLAFLWLDFYPAPFLQHRTTPSCPVLTHPSLLSSHTTAHCSFLSLGLFSHNSSPVCSFPCTTPRHHFVPMHLSSSATFSNFSSHTHPPRSLVTRLTSLLPPTPGPLTLQMEFLWGTKRPRHLSPQEISLRFPSCWSCFGFAACI